MHNILHYFPELPEEKKNRFIRLAELYQYWNPRVNLISRKDIPNLYLHHVLPSVFIAKIISFAPGTKIIDVGTGGGFPGIPLAILFPECDFLLIDSIGKKIHVVEDIIHKLDMNNVSCKVIRSEKITEKFDFVVGRAVTRFADFVQITRHCIRKQNINEFPNGIFYLTGGEVQKESSVFKDIRFFDVYNYFREPYMKEKKLVYLPVRNNFR